MQIHWLRCFSVLSLLLLTQLLSVVLASPYGKQLCHNQHYDCMTVLKGQSWQSLFPDVQQRQLVMRINRINIALRPGMTLAVPKELHRHNLMTVSPFPLMIGAQSSNVVIFDPKHLAWAAYDKHGQLVRWGAASGGKDYCSDVGRGCRTATGEFRVYHKRGAACKSSKYPIGKGGAPMPHCMFFHRGFAMHGSPVVPGSHASHGCIRLFNEDAAWLHQNFVISGKTRVIVESYED